MRKGYYYRLVCDHSSISDVWESRDLLRRRGEGADAVGCVLIGSSSTLKSSYESPSMKQSQTKRSIPLTTSILGVAALRLLLAVLPFLLSPRSTDSAFTGLGERYASADGSGSFSLGSLENRHSIAGRRQLARIVNEMSRNVENDIIAVRRGKRVIIPLRVHGKLTRNYRGK